MTSLQKRLFRILETTAGGRTGRAVNAFLVGLIILNVLAVTLHTVPGLAAKHDSYFRNFEFLSVAVFSLEYVLRLWVCVLSEGYRRPLAGRIKYVFSAAAIVDLVAVAPFYLPMISADLLFIRSLRLLRLLRLLKLGRYSESIKTMGAVLKAKKEAITVSASMSAILLVFSSALMFLIENHAQPEAFSSIPATMWWAVETMTTIGYGDIYPVTPAGKVLAGIIAIIGISLFVLPAGIIATGYSEEIQRRKDKRLVCPKCGHVIS
jgi:voltage-gated potassium channel